MSRRLEGLGLATDEALAAADALRFELRRWWPNTPADPAVAHAARRGAELTRRAIYRLTVQAKALERIAKEASR